MDISDIRYSRNFLSKVIFRLDFAPILLLQNEHPNHFQERIRSLLPQFQQQAAIEYVTQVQQGLKTDVSRSVTNWIFRDKNSRFQLTLNYQSLVIEDSHYTNLEGILSIVSPAVSAFSESYGNISYTRLGLRYINEIHLPTGNPFDWEGFISPHLTASIAKTEPKSQLARAMSQTVLSKETHTVVFNHGIFNSEFPAPITRREFILDLDASMQDVDASRIIELVRFLNSDLLRMFESSIGGNLRRLLQEDAT